MIKANELSDKQKAMAKQERKDYIDVDLAHALAEVEKRLNKVDKNSRHVYLSFSWLRGLARTDTSIKRHELCKALEKHRYKCKLLEGFEHSDGTMIVEWSHV